LRPQSAFAPCLGSKGPAEEIRKKKISIPDTMGEKKKHEKICYRLTGVSSSSPVMENADDGALAALRKEGRAGMAIICALPSTAQ
jgi:hypothetical protein